MFTLEDIMAMQVNIDGEIMSADMFFTTGYCDQLAFAISKHVSNSEIIALYDYLDEDGNSLNDGYLIHSGLYFNNKILDINGVHDADDWVFEWSELGEEVHPYYFQDDTCPFKWKSDDIKEISMKTATQLVRYAEKYLNSKSDQQHSNMLIQ